MLGAIRFGNDYDAALINCDLAFGICVVSELENCVRAVRCGILGENTVNQLPARDGNWRLADRLAWLGAASKNRS